MEGGASGLKVGVRYRFDLVGLPRSVTIATIWVMVVMMMAIMSNEMDEMRTIVME